MNSYFNVTGACNPRDHYMVDLQPRLAEIKALVDRGSYFTINRARQYGKTTTLNAMKTYLKEDYLVVSLDFQMLSGADFESEGAFVAAFAREVLMAIAKECAVPDKIKEVLRTFVYGTCAGTKLAFLFTALSDWCAESERPIVLMVDEVDSATNNQVFLDFLSQLRGYYIHREERPTFQSVILAGVYDVKNIKRKIRTDEEHRTNSPWNIATDFNIDMSLGVPGIARMLEEYEKDHVTGMDVQAMAQMLYDYTSGYPFLVSRLCKIMDEQIAGSRDYPDKAMAWTYAGFLEGVRILQAEKNTLFETLVNKLYDYPELKEIVYKILFTGKEIPYGPLNQVIEIAVMFGFVKNDKGVVIISNRIFETVFYNLFLTAIEVQSTEIYQMAVQDRNQFICNGHLNMELVLEKFVVHFDDLYGDQPDKFKEEGGRRYFLLYLRPIINGVGNYYIESRTRNMERTDVIVDYRGEQFVVELKLWRGDKYHNRGEKQLTEYLDYYHLRKGYMLSFNFNKKKEIGVKRINLGGKVLIEAVV